MEHGVAPNSRVCRPASAHFKNKKNKTMEKTKNMLVMRNIDANTRRVAKEHDNDYDLYIVTQGLWMGKLMFAVLL